jgi:hypothetical protein
MATAMTAGYGGFVGLLGMGLVAYHADVTPKAPKSLPAPPPNVPKGREAPPGPPAGRARVPRAEESDAGDGVPPSQIG